MTRAPDGAANLNAGGYGYGLRVSQSCDFDHIVAHTGGLPGYGSIMQWLPDYGVGIVAFGNVTYTGWTPIVAQAFALLAKTGGLERRAHFTQPSLQILIHADLDPPSEQFGIEVVPIRRMAYAGADPRLEDDQALRRQRLHDFPQHGP